MGQHRFFFGSLVVLSSLLGEMDASSLRTIVIEDLCEQSHRCSCSGADSCFGIDLRMDVPSKEKFIEALCCFISSPLDEETVLALKETIISFYQKQGYPIVGVFVPEKQDLSSGEIRLLVLVAKLGSVKAEGAKYFSNEKIASQFRTKPGEEIRSERVNEDLQWMNQNPFYSTSLLYEPGQKLGETDVVLLTQDRFPLRVYGGYENVGDPITGTPRFLAGLNWGNAFGVGHQFNYLFITETHPKNWYANMASYLIPLPWRDLFMVYGSYTLTEPSVGADLGLQGKGWQVCGKYSTLFTYSICEFEAYIGYEFKRTNNFLTFGVAPVFNNYIDISQFVLGLDAQMEYEAGNTSAEIKFYLSPGNMTAFNRTAYFLTERAGSKCNYIYGRFNLEQILKLPLGMTWAFNSMIQGSSAKLLPSEEMIFGGYYTVRGYDEFEVLSDNGVLIKNEIRSRPFQLPTFRKKKHEIQFLGFWDFGVSIQRYNRKLCLEG